MVADVTGTAYVSNQKLTNHFSLRKSKSRIKGDRIRYIRGSRSNFRKVDDSEFAIAGNTRCSFRRRDKSRGDVAIKTWTCFDDFECCIAIHSGFT